MTFTCWWLQKLKGENDEDGNNDIARNDNIQKRVLNMHLFYSILSPKNAILFFFRHIELILWNRISKVIEGLILTAFQAVSGYFMSRG